MPYPGWYVKSVSETRNPAVEVAARNGVKRCCRNQKRSVGEEMVILRRQCRSQLFVEFGAFYRTGLQHNSPLSICSAAWLCRVKGELGSILLIIFSDVGARHRQAVAARRNCPRTSPRSVRSRHPSALRTPCRARPERRPSFWARNLRRSSTWEAGMPTRTEERRVGQECVRKCRYGWAQ